MKHLLTLTFLSIALNLSTNVASSEENLPLEVGKFNATFFHDFATDGVPSKYFVIPNLRKGFEITPAGLRLTSEIPATQAKGSWASTELMSRFQVVGDFEIETTFDELELTGGPQCAVEMMVVLNDEQQSHCRVMRMHNVEGEWVYGQLSHINADGVRIYPFEKIRVDDGIKRFKLVRNGDTIEFLAARSDGKYLSVRKEKLTEAESVPQGIRIRALGTGDSLSSCLWKTLRISADKVLFMPSKTSTPSRDLYVVDFDPETLSAVGAPRKILEPEGQFNQLGSAEWSVDGTQLVMDAQRGGVGDSHILACDADGKNVRDLGPGCMPSYSPDMTQFVCTTSGKGIEMALFDGSGRVEIDRSGWGTQWSPDGKYIAYAKSGNIHLYETATATTQTVLTPKQSTLVGHVYWNLSWSHDSQSLLFKSRNPINNNSEVIVTDINSPQAFKVLLSTPKWISEDVTFCADNIHCVFATRSEKHNANRLFIVNRNDPASIKELPGMPDKMICVDCDISPDGTKIVFTATMPQQPMEWTQELAENGGEAE